VVASRQRFQGHQKRIRVEDLVFVDETGCHPGIGPLRGWAPTGARLFGPEQVYARKQHISIVGAISIEGLVAKMTVRGGVGSREFRRFVKMQLVPILHPGHIVCWDNLNAHKNKQVRAMVEDSGASIVFLPPYSPDLNPIELAWSKLKHFVRKHQSYTVPGLRQAIYRSFKMITASDTLGWFGHCGYGA
jgi:transposase